MEITWIYNITTNELTLNFKPVTEKQLSKILNLLNRMTKQGEVIEGNYVDILPKPT